MARDWERIFCDANLSFGTAFESSNMSCNTDHQVEALEQALESSDEGPPLPLARKPAHLAARSSSNVLPSAECQAIVRLTTKKNAARTFASQVFASMKRAAELQTLDEAIRIHGPFVKGALSLPCFVRKVANFIRRNMRDLKFKKKKELKPVEFSFSVIESPLASSR